MYVCEENARQIAWLEYVTHVDKENRDNIFVCVFWCAVIGWAPFAMATVVAVQV